MAPGGCIPVWPPPAVMGVFAPVPPLRGVPAPPDWERRDEP